MHLHNPLIRPDGLMRHVLSTTGPYVVISTRQLGNLGPELGELTFFIDCVFLESLDILHMELICRSNLTSYNLDHEAR